MVFECTVPSFPEFPSFPVEFPLPSFPLLTRDCSVDSGGKAWLFGRGFPIVSRSWGVFGGGLSEGVKWLRALEIVFL